MYKKYTIKDIAELAGVSKGTVDRVLHQRGKVSSKSLAQVQKVLKEIDYHPNPIARNLKNNKIYKICILMPNPEKDTYWIPAVQGIQKATNEFKPFGLVVNEYYYNPYDRSSFLEKSKEALQSPLDALLVVPLFQKEALDIYKICQESNIYVLSFNNAIDTYNASNYIGQDLYQSGRVAASLIEKLALKKSVFGVLHLDEEANMRLKENGFKTYFEENSNAPQINTFSLKTSNKETFKKEAIKLLQSNPEISAIFVTNSKAYRFIQAIEHLCNNITIVGYDLLEENIRYLENGCIDFLIHQKPKRQAYLGVGYLAEYFLFGKPIPSEKLLPIDIITTENVQYYLN